MPNNFYSGMKGPEAINKLNEFWVLVEQVDPVQLASAVEAAAVAATGASNAAVSASNAAVSAASASNSFDEFDDRYLGSKGSDPTVDNDGQTLIIGAIYWNNSANEMRVWNGTAWYPVQTTSAAVSAATSASNAAVSATSASTSASNAAVTAAAASNSAVSAATSATSASTSASNALVRSTAASNSAVSAATSATSASTSASNALVRSTAASNSALSASTSASNAAVSAASASNLYDQFDDRYLGSKATAPSTDNDGQALLEGTLYWNSDQNKLYIYDGSAWNAAAFDVSGSVTSFNTRTGAVTLQGNDVALLPSIDKINFSTSATGAQQIGTMQWNSGESTVDLRLTNDVTLQVGQEQVQKVYNGTGSTITNGSVVYITGAQGQRPSVALASASSEALSSKTFGVATEDILTGTEGFVCTEGTVRGLNTSSIAEGSALWLSTTAGTYTTTKPTSPDHLVFIGFCVRQHASSGSIFVHIQNGYELQEIHDVLLTSPTNGQLLKYNSTTQIWENSTFSPTITLGGDLSGNVTLTNLASGTLTATIAANSVALGTDTTGNYVASVATTSPLSGGAAGSEGSALTLSLASGYGDTQNPYASKTAKYFLAAPNASAGAPTFRAIVASDIPTLNQSTTGSAASVSGTTTAAVNSSALGSGTADNTTYLRGDRTWASIPQSGISTGKAIAMAIVFG